MLGIVFEGGGLNQAPEFVEVEDGGVEFIFVEVEEPHADFAEVAGMVSVHGDSHVGEATGVTPSARMLPVFADSASSAADRTSEFPCFS